MECKYSQKCGNIPPQSNLAKLGRSRLSTQFHSKSKHLDIYLYSRHLHRQRPKTCQEYTRVLGMNRKNQIQNKSNNLEKHYKVSKCYQMPNRTPNQNNFSFPGKSHQPKQFQLQNKYQHNFQYSKYDYCYEQK